MHLVAGKGSKKPRELELRGVGTATETSPNEAAMRSQDSGSPLYMQDPRKPVNRSFIAKRVATCDRCHLEIEIGQRARYAPNGHIVHHQHTQVETPVETCSTCWLTICDCD